MDKGGVLEGDGGMFPVFVFLAGIGKGVGRLWPFRRDKRLKKLMEEADANPMDAAKQSALLAEMNKSRFDCSSCLVSLHSLHLLSLVLLGVVILVAVLNLLDDVLSSEIVQLMVEE